MAEVCHRSIFRSRSLVLTLGEQRRGDYDDAQGFQALTSAMSAAVSYISWDLK